MPQNRWKNKRKEYCNQCGVTSGQGAHKLNADRNDGKLYCVKCWEAYYGSPPEDADSCDQPAKATPANSAGRENKADELDAAPGAAARAVLEKSTDDAPAADAMLKKSADDAPAVDASPPISDGDAGTSTHEQAIAAGSSVPMPEALACFARRVAELRAAAAAGEHGPCEEEQSEELMALEAIYGDKLKKPDPEAPQPLVLSLQLEVQDESGHEIWVETPDGQVLAGVVQSLPPLILHCALPRNYPADDRPVFALASDFFSRETLEALSQELSKIADERPGEPLLFEWASLLQESGLAPKRIELAGGDAGMDVALQLLAWDQSERNAQRQQMLQVCPVCFDEVLGSKGIFFSCNHFGCRPCLEQMAQIHTGEAAISALCCPVPECREALDVAVLRDLLGADSEEFKRWEELSLRQCLDRMQDVVFCPRCDADGDGERIPCIQDEDRMAQCGQCGFIFCGRCRDVYHPGTSCASTDDRMSALESRAAGRGRDAEAARAELMTLRHLARTTKQCPGCSSTIEKIEGCSKMKCRTCGIYFCWRCGKEITGYDHFASSECKLFDDEEIRRWNERGHQVLRAEARAHEARFLAQFMNPEEFWEQMRQCPSCKSQVMRDGKNNHMKCYACSTQFCANCNCILPRKNPGSHFGRTGVCAQHSA